MNIQLIANYKKETQQKIIETLECYDRVKVTVYPSGLEMVTVGTMIKKSYSQDERNAQKISILAADLFTPEERNANYKKSFGYDRYPQFI